MKSSQWIGALVVLVVMVFAITFAMNFLNTGKSADGGPPATTPGIVNTGDGRNLTFYVKTLPPDPDPLLAIYHEDRQPGYLDFLFENPNAEDVKIGLIAKNCRCASVHLLLATPEWKTRRALLGAAESAVALGFVFDPAQLIEMASRVTRTDQDQELQELQRGYQPVATLEPGSTQAEAVVPAKSLGFIRVAWIKDKTGLERFKADLWIGGPQTGMNATLDAEVHFVQPVEADSTDLRVNELNETDLEKKPYQGTFHIWSSTRPALKLRTEVVHPARYGADRFDPFVVEPPLPLTGDALTAFKNATPSGAGARCAYRVEFKLYGRSSDGKVAIDLGGFRRRLKVWREDDPTVEPMELTVTGSVQGSVLIGGPEDAGRLSLGVFDSSAGSASQALPLTGKTAGVALEVDKERTPEFLRDGARLEKLADLAGLPRWKLHVRVLPNAAQGFFPRVSDPLYYDSAVYLKVKGAVIQNVRIPVDGTANAQ